MSDRKLIVFIDSGDTIIDEGTQVFDDQGTVVSADMIAGAGETIKALHDKGYVLVLVADGGAQSFKNVLTQNGIYDYFSALIYSENIKVCKPDIRMFKAAAGALNLSESDFWRIVMVGNNLSRDIKGANEAGITSIFLNWTSRYPHIPADKSEVPDYTISQPLELIDLVDDLNSHLFANNLDLIKKYAPSIYFDEKEPFYPVFIGCTVFEEPGVSPSFDRHITFSSHEMQYVIEYAIYWHFDIQHLFELEHVWIYVDRSGAVVDCEASFHGIYLKGLRKNRSNIENGTHVLLYSQPGKHAFTPYAELFELLPDLVSSTDDDAGIGGLMVSEVVKGLLETNDEINLLVKKHLEKFRFRPSMNFVKYEYPDPIFIPWDELKRLLPELIEEKLMEIRQSSQETS